MGRAMPPARNRGTQRCRDQREQRVSSTRYAAAYHIRHRISARSNRITSPQIVSWSTGVIDNPLAVLELASLICSCLMRHLGSRRRNIPAQRRVLGGECRVQRVPGQSAPATHLPRSISASSCASRPGSHVAPRLDIPMRFPAAMRSQCRWPQTTEHIADRSNQPSVYQADGAQQQTSQRPGAQHNVSMSDGRYRICTLARGREIISEIAVTL